ncbi:TctA family transporter [Bradyrhizobium sp. S3.2.12]
MEALGLLIHDFAVVLTWKTLVLMMIRLVLGIFVGVLPGLGGPNGVAILLPMLALGIPGSGTVAILLGGLMVCASIRVRCCSWSTRTSSGA